jgi:hypothetical protein
MPEGFPRAPWSRKKWKYKRGTWGWAICAATLFPLVRKELPEQYRGPLPSWVPNQAHHLHTLRAHQLNELLQAGCDGLPSFASVRLVLWTHRRVCGLVSICGALFAGAEWWLWTRTSGFIG